jgi:hypothetical protein
MMRPARSQRRLALDERDDRSCSPCGATANRFHDGGDE